jgi:hypothetical protein
VAFQDPAALTDGGTRGEDIIDQADNRIIGGKTRTRPKDIFQIFPPIYAPQGSLRHRASDPDEPFRPNSLKASGKKHPGEQHRLIQPPWAKPVKVQGDRDNPLTIGKDRQVAATDKIGERADHGGISAILQFMNQLSHGSLIHDQRPGKTVRRGLAKAFTADMSTACLPDLFHPADRTEGRTEEMQIRQAGSAHVLQATDLQPHPACSANRGKEQVHPASLQKGNQFHWVDSVNSFLPAGHLRPLSRR